MVLLGDNRREAMKEFFIFLLERERETERWTMEKNGARYEFVIVDCVVGVRRRSVKSSN